LIGTYSERIFLAGGLCPENIEKALNINVYGVDICSGIESEPGKKDHQKMKQLFDVIGHYTKIKVNT
jgi:indole-3-glycerol phosphate synthase/phosphoribosylanthranilate isomerase